MQAKLHFRGSDRQVIQLVLLRASQWWPNVRAVATLNGTQEYCSWRSTWIPGSCRLDPNPFSVLRWVRGGVDLQLTPGALCLTGIPGESENAVPVDEMVRRLASLPCWGPHVRA